MRATCGQLHVRFAVRPWPRGFLVPMRGLRVETAATPQNAVATPQWLKVHQHHNHHQHHNQHHMWPSPSLFVAARHSSPTMSCQRRAGTRTQPWLGRGWHQRQWPQATPFITPHNGATQTAVSPMRIRRGDAALRANAGHALKPIGLSHQV